MVWCQLINNRYGTWSNGCVSHSGTNAYLTVRIIGKYQFQPVCHVFIWFGAGAAPKFAEPIDNASAHIESRLNTNAIGAITFMIDKSKRSGYFYINRVLEIINYMLAGCGKEKVVMLHGWKMDHICFNSLLPALNERTYTLKSSDTCKIQVIKNWCRSKWRRISTKRWSRLKRCKLYKKKRSLWEMRSEEKM